MQSASPYAGGAVVPTRVFDEAVAGDGTLRPGWSSVWSSLARLGPEELRDRQRQADRLLDAEGTGHLVHDLGDEHQGGGPTALSRPWRVDPVPLVLGQDEFRLLADGVAQRVRLLEAVLDDLRGARRLVREGVVPAQRLFALPSLRTTISEHRPPRWLTHVAIDVARGSDGRWRVVQDLLDTATGAGYALLNRSVLARVLPDAVRSCAVVPLTGFADSLRHALSSSAPIGRRAPRTVVLGGTPTHASYVEHSYLATQMGFHLVEAGDLVVRGNRVWLRALDGVEPVDVVYRRIDDTLLDPLDAGMAGGVPAITWAARAGGVVLANAFGTALAEDLGAHTWGRAAADLLLGEPLELDVWRTEDGLATSPCQSSSPDEPIVPGHVVLRLHVVVGADGATVMEGGNGRVLAPGDHPSQPTSHVSKDVWVVGRSAGAVGRPHLRMPQAQVDFGASVTKRTADGMYWMGRAAERAEVAARTTRVVGGQIHQDDGLLTVGRGGWAEGALALLRAARSVPTAPGGGEVGGILPPSYLEALTGEVDETRRTVARQISMLVDEAMSVRSYLSTATGRVLNRLSSVAADLLRADAAVDDLDMVLVDLAALAGLTMESVVRGPAWRFLDLGRRLERALALLGSIEATLAPAVDPLAFQPLSETLLWTNESLVAYRRRYRSDVELSAVLDLLVHDDANPRSLAFQLDRIREHVASLGWQQGSELVERASLGSITPVDDRVSGGRRLQVDMLVLDTRGPLLELGAAVVERWFSDPVDPMVLGAT